jgi:hypothetical protein
MSENRQRFEHRVQGVGEMPALSLLFSIDRCTDKCARVPYPLLTPTTSN